MMNEIRYLTTVITGLVLFSCNDLPEETSGYESSVLNENVHPDTVAFFNKTQTFQFNNTSDTTFIGLEGTGVHLQKDCFKNTTGIQLELIEYYDIPSFLMQGLSTTSNGHLIDSKGMVYLDAKGGKGESIASADLDKIQLSFPSLSDSDLVYTTTDSVYRLFKGDYVDGVINWSPKYDLVPRATVRNADTIHSYLYNNIFSIPGLGWINCDKFIPQEKTEDLTIKISDEVRNLNPSYNLVFYDYNSVLRGSLKSKGNVKFSDVPSNKKASLVVIASSDKSLYYERLDLNTSDNKLYLDNLNQIDEPRLMQQLKLIFGDDLNNRPDPKF